MPYPQHPWWTRARSLLERGAEILRGSGGFVWKFARVAAIALVALCAVYLVGANIALRASVLPDYLDDTEEEVRIHYASAWTVWPGKVHVSRLLVATQDGGVQSEIRAQRASATIALWPLLDKKVVISAIRATSVSVRIRGRRAEADAVKEQAALPPMSTWGVLALEDPEAKPKTDPSALWHVILDDAAGTVDEVWVEGVRVTGRIQVRGTFDFAPLKKVIVDRVRGTLHDGRLELMGQPDPVIADGLDGRYVFSVPDFDVPGHELSEILRFADLDLDVTGLVYPEHASRPAAPPSAGQPSVGAKSAAPIIEDGSGAIRIRASARQGRLRRGSRILYETAHLGIEGGPVRAKMLDATANVLARTDEDIVTEVDARVVDLLLAPAPRSPIHIESASASIDARMVPHFMSPTFEGGEASILAANMGLAGLDGIAEGVRLRKGIAFARGHLKVDRNGVANGEAHTRVEEIDAVVMGASVRGRSTGEVHLDEARLTGEKSIPLRSFLTLDDVAMKVGKERVDGWWGRLELGGHLTQQGDAPWAIDGTMLGRFRDARPMVAILEGGHFVPGIVAEQLVAEGLVANASIEVRGPRVQFDVKDATGKEARIRGRMVMTEEEMRASYLVQTDLIDVGVSLVNGGTQVQLLAGEDWLIRERAFLSGFGRTARRPAATPTVR